MPILTVTTNVAKEVCNNSATVLELSKLVAKVTGKPESYVSVIVKSDAVMSFGGVADAPSAYVTLESIGGFSNRNEVCKQLTEAIARLYSIPDDRFYIKLMEISAMDVAFRGNTFG